MEQIILLYTSTEIQVFLDLHAIIYNQDVCGLQTRIGMRARMWMWQKAKIVFTIFLFVLESHTKHKNKEKIFLNANSKPQAITQGKTFLNE